MEDIQGGVCYGCGWGPGRRVTSHAHALHPGVE